MKKDLKYGKKLERRTETMVSKYIFTSSKRPAGYQDVEVCVP